MNNDFLNETFDYKRFVLLNMKKCYLLILGAILGALVFGGSYYLKNVIFAGSPLMRAEALYYISFNSDEVEAVHDYYNDYTWRMILDSDVIAGRVSELTAIDKEVIANSSWTATMSDIRMLTLYIDDYNQDTALLIQEAYGQALMEFAEKTEGFNSIEIWDGPKVYEAKPELFTLRVSVAGGIIGLIVAGLYVLYMNAMDDSIYTLSDVKKRYGIAPAGMILKNDSEYCNASLKKNLLNELDGKKKVCIVSAYTIAGIADKEFDLEAFSNKVDIKDIEFSYIDKYENYDELKKYDGLVLLLKYGNRDCSVNDLAFNNLEVAGIKPDAVVITEYDKWMLKNYYKGDELK